MNSRILLLAPAKASQHSMQEKLYSAITKSLVEQEVLRFEIGPGAITPMNQDNLWNSCNQRLQPTQIAQG